MKIIISKATDVIKGSMTQFQEIAPDLGPQQ